MTMIRSFINPPPLPAYDDLPFAVSIANTGAAAPPLTNFGGTGTVKVPAFGGAATMMEIFGTVEILHWYKEGSDLYPHIHWAAGVTTAGSVKWGLEWWAANGNETFKSGNLFLTDPSIGIWKHNLVGFPSVISGQSLKIGAIFNVRLFRDPTDPADDLGGAAFFFQLAFHAEIDSFGSRGIFTK